MAHNATRTTPKHTRIAELKIENSPWCCFLTLPAVGSAGGTCFLLDSTLRQKNSFWVIEGGNIFSADFEKWHMCDANDRKTYEDGRKQPPVLLLTQEMQTNKHTTLNI